MLLELLARLAARSRGRDVEREMDAELAFHVDMQTEANLARGMSREAARAAALRSLGGVDQVKEAVRDTRATWFDSVWQDVRYGLRVLRKFPAYTIGVLATLGLGIGITTAVFSVADATALRPLPYPRPERLFGVHSRSTSGRGDSTGVSTRDFLAWRDHQQNFGQVALVGGGSFKLIEGEPEELRGCKVTGDLFAILGARPLLGRVFGREHEITGNHQVAVIGYGFWQRRFAGDPHIVGRRLRFDDGVYEVLGVMPADFKYPAAGRPMDLWTPFTFAAAAAREDASPGWGAVLRVKDGVTARQAGDRLEALSAGLKPIRGFGCRPFLVPLREIELGDATRWMAMLLAAAAFVLLTACANVAHLTLSRAASRSRELAVRTALGGGRLRLARQLATESLLLSAGATAAGVAVACGGVRILAAATPRRLVRLADISVDARVLAFAAALGLATGLVCAVLPAVWSARADIVAGLKEGGALVTPGRRGRRVREVLAFSEVALSLVLLAGAGLFIASFAQLMIVDPGFDVRNVMVLEVDVPSEAASQGRALADMQAVLERLRQTRGVAGAGVISTGWMFGGSRMTFPAHEPGAPRPTGLENATDFAWVMPGFFRALGVPLLAGRDLTERDTLGAPPVLLVNQSAARRHWGSRNALGRRLVVEDRAYEVVGVVGDIAHLGTEPRPRPELYIPMAQKKDDFYGSFVARVDAPSADVTAAIRQATHSVWPHQPITRLATLEDGISRAASTRRFNMTLMALFGVLAVVIAISGLNGVMSCSVDERRREIAIRLALGATRGHVVFGVLARSAAIVLAGAAAGTGAAWALGRYVESYLFEVSPHDPRVLGAAAGLLALAALVACWPPARRASATDPVTALKAE